MCDICRDGRHPLRDTPATDYELYLMRKHRAASTAPAMPKWYQAHWRKCTGRVYTAICDARAMLFDVIAVTKREQGLPQVYKYPDAYSTKRYVREFCKLNNLRT